MVDYIMLMVIFAAYGRFLVLQCHDQQGFLQEIFEMRMLLGQQWVKPGQFYVACGGSFQIFFYFGCIFSDIFLYNMYGEYWLEVNICTPNRQDGRVMAIESIIVASRGVCFLAIGINE